MRGHHVSLICNSWQIANPQDANFVEVEEPHSIWRCLGAVLARRGVARDEVRRFVGFLAGPAGDYITGTTITADGGLDVVGPGILGN